MELILVIVILVLLFGGGGYWGRRPASPSPIKIAAQRNLRGCESSRLPKIAGDRGAQPKVSDCRLTAAFQPLSFQM
jgi:hypothetical protein